MRSRLQAISEDSGLSVSDVCRLAVDQFLSEVEQTRKITLKLSKGAKAARGSAPKSGKAKGKSKKKGK